MGTYKEIKDGGGEDLLCLEPCLLGKDITLVCIKINYGLPLSLYSLKPFPLCIYMDIKDLTLIMMNY
jgi:hypothetical protein